jgi:hypothetical protein
MTEPVKKVKRKARTMLRVGKGMLTPADEFSAAELKAKNWKIGDIVAAELTKCRNPMFNRLAHRIGKLVAINIEEFSSLDAHKVLKRIQLEANIGCSSVMFRIDGYGMVEQRIPDSLAFDQMDEAEFQKVIKQICTWVATKYWHTLTAEQVQVMAETFVDEY